MMISGSYLTPLLTAAADGHGEGCGEGGGRARRGPRVGGGHRPERGCARACAWARPSGGVAAVRRAGPGDGVRARHAAVGPGAPYRHGSTHSGRGHAGAGRRRTVRPVRPGGEAEAAGARDLWVRGVRGVRWLRVCGCGLKRGVLGVGVVTGLRNARFGQGRARRGKSHERGGARRAERGRGGAFRTQGWSPTGRLGPRCPRTGSARRPPFLGDHAYATYSRRPSRGPSGAMPYEAALTRAVPEGSQLLTEGGSWGEGGSSRRAALRERPTRSPPTAVPAPAWSASSCG